MYIRPKLLWWGVPAFLLLFLLGIALGSTESQGGSETLPARPAHNPKQEDALPLAGLLDQLTQKGERSFIVYMQDYTLNGTYDQERFHLTGKIGGHALEMKRDEQQQVTVLIDGVVQDHTALPYALFTPHEHAQLLKGVLHTLQAIPVQKKSDQGWRGFRLSVPSQEVASLLDMWLGPSFPVRELDPDVAKQIAVDYLLWYDEQSGRVHQLEIELQIRTAAGEKRDTLRFRL